MQIKIKKNRKHQKLEKKAHLEKKVQDNQAKKLCRRMKKNILNDIKIIWKKAKKKIKFIFIMEREVLRLICLILSLVILFLIMLLSEKMKKIGRG